MATTLLQIQLSNFLFKKFEKLNFHQFQSFSIFQINFLVDFAIFFFKTLTRPLFAPMIFSTFMCWWKVEKKCKEIERKTQKKASPATWGNCKICKFVYWKKKKKSLLKFLLNLLTINFCLFFSLIRCSSPPQLQGKCLGDIPNVELRCEDNNWAIYPIVWSAIGVLIVALIAMIAFVIAKRPISQWKLPKRGGNTVSYKNVVESNNDLIRILTPGETSDRAEE